MNGIQRLTGYAGYNQFLEGRGAIFGVAGATANFNLMKFDAPASAPNPAAPTTNFAAWRVTAPQALTTVDFESFATGAVLTGNEYAAIGVTLQQRNADPMRIGAAGDGSFISAANARSPTHVVSSSAVPGFPFGYDGARSENYDFVFADAPNAAGLWVGNLNPGMNTVSVQFLDGAGVVLATQALNTLDQHLVVGASGQFDNRVFVGINSPTPVSRIRVNNAAGDQDGIVFDDVVFGPLAMPLPTVSLDKVKLYFGAVTLGQTFQFQTSAQAVRLTQTGAGTVTWTATANRPWLVVSPASGNGSATLSIGVTAVPGLPPAGKDGGAVTLTFTGAANTAGPIEVQLTLLSSASAAPFGFVDTPFDNATGVTGAVPFTGWMLDHIEVDHVYICRAPVAGESAPPQPKCTGTNQIFIGEAVFIEAARPDVARDDPEIPLNSRAGWGLMVLTNMLPAQGNGTFVFYMWGINKQGITQLLGTRTITCDNAHATKPFGAIDTPEQGGLASGAAYVNFGWALTPQPKMIPIDGSTISVIVDGVAVGTATSNHDRPDVRALFPGLANTNGAGWLRVLDTTAMTNGTHTIAWVVADSQGVAEGIGSRYFNVSNGVGSLTAYGGEARAAEALTPPGSSLGIDRLPLDTSPVPARLGWISVPPTIPCRTKTRPGSWCAARK